MYAWFEVVTLLRRSAAVVIQFSHPPATWDFDSPTTGSISRLISNNYEWWSYRTINGHSRGHCSLSSCFAAAISSALLQSSSALLTRSFANCLRSCVKFVQQFLCRWRVIIERLAPANLAYPWVLRPRAKCYAKTWIEIVKHPRTCVFRVRVRR